MLSTPMRVIAPCMHLRVILTKTALGLNRSTTPLPLLFVAGLTALAEQAAYIWFTRELELQLGKVRGGTPQRLHPSSFE